MLQSMLRRGAVLSAAAIATALLASACSSSGHTSSSAAHSGDESGSGAPAGSAGGFPGGPTSTLHGGGVNLPTGPGGPINVAGWRLTLPIDAKGGTSGGAKTVKPVVVTAPYFTQDAKGDYVFWAPDGGAHTPDSQHPRTELVSETDFMAARSGRHTLAATITVTQVPTLPPPSQRGIVIGQLHGGGRLSADAFVLLHYRYDPATHVGDVDATVEQGTAPGHKSLKYALLPSVPLNVPISFTITDDGTNTLTVTARAGTAATHSADAPVPPAFQNADVRFQTGDYQQSVGPGPASDGGRVTLSALSLS